MVTSDPTVALKLALSGFGIVILPLWMAKSPEVRRALVQILPQWVPEPITLCVRYSQIPRGSRQKFKCCWTFSTNTWEPIVIHD